MKKYILGIVILIIVAIFLIGYTTSSKVRLETIHTALGEDVKVEKRH